MIFTERTIPTGPCFISDCGKYKIVNYGGQLKAYFKPAGWKNFGNGCRSGLGMEKTYTYKDIVQAQKDCELHLSTFGKRPNQFDKLKGEIQ